MIATSQPMAMSVMTTTGAICRRTFSFLQHQRRRTKPVFIINLYINMYFTCSECILHGLNMFVSLNLSRCFWIHMDNVRGHSMQKFKLDSGSLLNKKYKSVAPTVDLWKNAFGDCGGKQIFRWCFSDWEWLRMTHRRWSTIKQLSTILPTSEQVHVQHTPGALKALAPTVRRSSGSVMPSRHFHGMFYSTCPL